MPKEGGNPDLGKIVWIFGRNDFDKCFSVLKKSGRGSPAQGRFSTIFQCSGSLKMRESGSGHKIQDPEANDFDKCFSQFWKIGQGFPCTRQVSQMFSVFSDSFKLFEKD